VVETTKAGGTGGFLGKIGPTMLIKLHKASSGLNYELFKINILYKICPGVLEVSAVSLSHVCV